MAAVSPLNRLSAEAGVGSEGDGDGWGRWLAFLDSAGCRFCVRAAFSQAAHTGSMALPVPPCPACRLISPRCRPHPPEKPAAFGTKCQPRFTRVAGRPPATLCVAPISGNRDGQGGRTPRGIAGRIMVSTEQVGLARRAGRSGCVFRLSGFKFHRSALAGVVGGDKCLAFPGERARLKVESLKVAGRGERVGGRSDCSRSGLSTPVRCSHLTPEP